MSWPGVQPNIGYFATNPCFYSVTTVTGVTISIVDGGCSPGSGVVYTLTFTLSGALGANETLELWQEIYKDAEGAPGLTYNNTLGRFTTSPLTSIPGWNLVNNSNAGPGTTHDYNKTGEIRVVPISSVAGSGVTCDSAQDTHGPYTAPDCTE